MASAVAILLLVPVVAGAIVQLLFRSLAFSGVVVLAPVPGLVVFLISVVFLPASGWPPATLVTLPLALSWACTILFADNFALKLSDNISCRDAFKASVQDQVRPYIGILLVAGAIAATAIAFDQMQLSLALALALASSTGVLRLLRAYPLGEDSIARMNRNREFIERHMGILIPAARARWGFSLSGVMIVIASIAIFGMQPLHVPRSPSGVIFCFSGLVIAGLICWMIVRDWRASVVLLASAALLLLLGLWCYARTGVHIGPPILLVLALAILSALCGQAVLFARIGKMLGEGDDATVAVSRALLRYGSGCLVANATLVIVALSTLQLAILPVAVLGFFTGVLLGPALLAVLETLAPRAETPEARYRVR